MVSPMLASAAMALSSVSVVSNSLRLRTYAKQRERSAVNGQRENYATA